MDAAVTEKHLCPNYCDDRQRNPEIIASPWLGFPSSENISSGKKRRYRVMTSGAGGYDPIYSFFSFAEVF